LFFNRREVPSSQCGVEQRIVNEIELLDEPDDKVCCPLSEVMKEDLKKACSQMKGFKCVTTRVSNVRIYASVI
jgi:hypothetical protein